MPRSAVRFAAAVVLALTVALVGPLFGLGPHASPAATAHVLWQFRTTAPLLTPVLREGTVYVGGADGFVYAIDAATGHARWGVDAGRPVATSMVVDGGTVYLANGDLTLIDAGTGVLGLRVRNDRFRLIALTARGGVVYAGGASGATGFVSAEEPGLGSELWRVETASVVAAPPVVDGATVYAASLGGEVFALDVVTGTVRWDAVAPGVVVGSPVVVDDLVVVASRNRTQQGASATAAAGLLQAFDAASGSERWRTPLAMAPQAGPAGNLGLLCVAGGGKLVAVEAATGAERWRAAVLAGDGAVPRVAGATVVVGAADGALLALGQRDGVEQWRVVLPDAVSGAAAAAATTAYVVSGTSLYAVAAA